VKWVWPDICSGKLVTMANARKINFCRDLKDNLFSGSVPVTLLERSRAGKLTLRYALL